MVKFDNEIEKISYLKDIECPIWTGSRFRNPDIRLLMAMVSYLVIYAHIHALCLKFVISTF